MNRFDYVRPATLQDAIGAIAGDPGAKIIAGGTNIVDLMKYDVAKPSRIVDIGRLPLKDVEDRGAEGVRIGALVTNADAAYHSVIQRRLPLLASAILAGASGQLRNAATTGGNLLQRTRCYYFYDPSTPCNKREPGSGCPAKEGVNRIHAVLGTSESCIAVHPSDMCVALAALDAQVNVEGPNGPRTIPFAGFHRLPGDTPHIDTNLGPGEIIASVDVPDSGFGQHHTYLKLRDRLSYAFALVSVAAALKIEQGEIVDARLALGGVAHKPWRDPDAEALLLGRGPSSEAFDAVAAKVMAGAKGFGHNDFKIELARRAIRRAVSQAARGAPQSQSDKRVH